MTDQNCLVYRQVDTVTAPSIPRPAHYTSGPHGDPVDPGGHAGAVAPRRTGRAALIWGIASTVLSAVGFLGLTLFEQYNDSLNELRRDLKHFNEVSGDFVKKDNIQKVRDRIHECLREMQASALVRAEAERQLQASEKERKELSAELQRLRERLATVEGRQAATAIVVPAPRADK